MAGHGGKLPQKITSKVKSVKIGKWSNKVQRSLDSYKLSSHMSQTPKPSVSGVNMMSFGLDVDDVDVDLEAPFINDGTEWIDVKADEIDQQNTTKAQTRAHNLACDKAGNSGKSWAQVVSPGSS